MRQLPYGIAVTTGMSVAEAEEVLRSALDRRPYKILGACNPVLASQALETDEHIGLLLPCNVVVYETAEGTAVEALEPSIMSQMVEDDAIGPIAEEARKRLVRALLAVETA
jgi:uncharacterized protein (DUF302 family)